MKGRSRDGGCAVLRARREGRRAPPLPRGCRHESDGDRRVGDPRAGARRLRSRDVAEEEPSPCRRLFHTAIRVGRRARSQTHIGRYAVSVSSTAVGLARSTLGQVAGKTVLVVGAGEAGKLTARSLREGGVSTPARDEPSAERARELATELGGTAVPFEDLDRCLMEPDISSAPPHPSTSSSIARAWSPRGRIVRSPAAVIDIAVPRVSTPPPPASPACTCTRSTASRTLAGPPQPPPRRSSAGRGDDR